MRKEDEGGGDPPFLLVFKDKYALQRSVARPVYPHMKAGPQSRVGKVSMNAIVKAILPGSPASGTRIAPGDMLRKINGENICDVLDYKYHSYDSRLLLEFQSANGKLRLVRLLKKEGEDVGLEFESFLMDRQKSCINKCIFCFIDQLPRGMRKTLYYKDDDIRLSFLQGNYVTLTNLSPHDVKRIAKMRISPVNVSVHTLDPELRAHMLGTEHAAAGIEILKTLAKSGIALNCQIVCCPGVNDGAELQRTIRGLYKLGPGIRSVSIVPVGLTKFRHGLAKLQPFDHELATKTVRLVEGYGRECLKRRGSTLFFCADEMYMAAGLELPPNEFYEDYPQLENGVGMMRLFITEFMDEFRKTETGASSRSFSIATGTAAYEYLTNLLKITLKKYGKIRGKTYAVRNRFFGDGVTVSGLVTGGDIIAQLKGRELGSSLLIPQNMLRHGDDVFLDNVTVREVSEALGVPVRIVGQNGAALLRAMLGD